MSINELGSNLSRGEQWERKIGNLISKAANPKCKNRYAIFMCSAVAIRPTVDYFSNQTDDKNVRRYSAVRQAAIAAVFMVLSFTFRTIGQKFGYNMAKSGYVSLSKVVENKIKKFPQQADKIKNDYYVNVSNTVAFYLILAEIPTIGIFLYSKLSNFIDSKLKKLLRKLSKTK